MIAHSAKATGNKKHMTGRKQNILIKTDIMTKQNILIKTVLKELGNTISKLTIKTNFTYYFSDFCFSYFTGGFSIWTKFGKDTLKRRVKYDQNLKE